ncbi:MAG: hypothetical protein R2755_16330 [Acidimicrobiales bacterium]
MWPPSRRCGLLPIFAGHPDHLAVGEAALCAVYPDACNPFAHPELLDEGHAEHTVQEVWLSGSPTVDTWVDITETFERKLAALACHASQVSHHEQQAFRERLVTWAQAQAGSRRLACGPAGRGVPTGPHRLSALRWGFAARPVPDGDGAGRRGNRAETVG